MYAGERDPEKLYDGRHRCQDLKNSWDVRKERGWVARAKAPRKEELQVHWTGW